MQGGDGLDFFLAAQHAALEFEVVEAVARARRLGQPNHRVGGHGFFMAQAGPVVVGSRVLGVGQVGLLAVPDVEQVTQHLHCVTLLAFTE